MSAYDAGDEIVDPGTPLKPGQLYNSNRPMLKRLLETFGAEVVQLVSVPDDYAQTVALLNHAAAEADVVVSTGGVSVGEEDHVKAALESLGQLDMGVGVCGRVAISTPTDGGTTGLPCAGGASVPNRHRDLYHRHRPAPALYAGGAALYARGH